MESQQADEAGVAYGKDWLGRCPEKNHTADQKQMMLAEAEVGGWKTQKWTCSRPLWLITG